MGGYEVVRGCNVVVVEDDSAVNSIICDTVSELGHNPIPFKTGQSAINYLTNKGHFGVEGYKTAALILSDLSMPEGSGKDVLDARNSLDDFIPFYLVSGVANPHDTALMASHKLSGYICKDNLCDDLGLTVRNVLNPKVHPEKPVVVWKIGGSADDFDQDYKDKKDLKEALAQLYSLQVWGGVQIVVTSGAGRQGIAWKKRLKKYGGECEAIRKEHPKRIMKCVDDNLSFLENLLGEENAIHIDAETMMRNYTRIDPYFFLNQNKIVLMGVAPRHLTLCRSDLVGKEEDSYPNIPAEDSDSHTVLLAELFGSEYIGVLKRTDQIYKYDVYKGFWKGKDQWVESQKENKPLGPISWCELLRGFTENDLVSRVVEGGNDPNDLPEDSPNHLFEDSGLKLFGKSNVVKRMGFAHVSPLELYPDIRHVVLRDQIMPYCTQNVLRKMQIYAVHDGTSKACITK